jgi:REP element-mobilizing transposase RayT
MRLVFILKLMTTGYRIEDQSALYFLTLSVVGWIDIFSRQRYRDIVIESLKYCQQNLGLQVFAYVIMTNHIHLIVNSPMGNLSATIRELKKFTSKEIIKSIKSDVESRREWMLELFQKYALQHKRNKTYQFWTHDNHAVLLYSNSFIESRLTYLHENPVRAGWVENPEDYLYSSATNYAGKTSLLDVILLDISWKTFD